MSSPDTGNTGSVTFGTSAFAVDITRIGSFGMRQPVLNASKLTTTINEEYVQGDLCELDSIPLDYWFDPGIDAAPKKPPIASIQGSAQSPESITLTWPIQSGQATAFLVVGSGWMHEFALPELLNNTLQASSFGIQFAGGSSGPTFTAPTAS